MPQWLDLRAPNFESEFSKLLTAKRDSQKDVSRIVEDIIDQVVKSGDQALIDLTRKFDRFTLTPDTLKFSHAELENARNSIPSDLRAALEYAAHRIRAFHERQRPRDSEYVDADGVTLGLRWSAIEQVGIYVPGGSAAYPSSVLMNAIPAVIAGAKRIVMMTPTPDGAVNSAVLAAASILGVSEIYRIGGAQAVAALAFGTQSIAPVDKIVGPGNAYVAAAKRQVFGKVGIDSIAGPSEVLIIADGSNNPEWIALDLMAQAEHDATAQSILITNDEGFARKVAAWVEGLLTTLSRAAIARQSWDHHGAIILVPTLADAPSLANRIAPEHLQLCVPDAKTMSAQISSAGAIFLGAFTPEAIGDYVGGPNHVLPTDRTARFASGLSVYDFMKRTTILGCDKASLHKLGNPAATLADAEGLSAHARSIRVRLGDD